MGLYLAPLLAGLLDSLRNSGPCTTLKERAQLSSSAVKTAHADTVHTPPKCSLHDHSPSEVHSPQQPLSEDELLSNLSWIHHSESTVCSQVHVLQASSEQPVVHSDDQTNVCSLLQEYKDAFYETVLPQCQVNPLRST